MFRRSVVENQRLILALISGVVLMLLVVLAYLPMWRPRRKDLQHEESHDGLMDTYRRTPWFLTLILAGLIVFAIVFMIHSVVHPPNW